MEDAEEVTDLVIDLLENASFFPSVYIFTFLN